MGLLRGGGAGTGGGLFYQRRDSAGLGHVDGVTALDLYYGRTRPLGHGTLGSTRDHPGLRRWQFRPGGSGIPCLAGRLSLRTSRQLASIGTATTPAPEGWVAGQVCPGSGSCHFWRILVVIGRDQTFGCVHCEHPHCDRTAFRLAAGSGLAARASQSIGGYRSLPSVSWRSVACPKCLTGFRTGNPPHTFEP